MGAQPQTETIDMPRVLTAYGQSAMDWFAVIDPALDASLPRRARDAGLMVQSLYDGRLGAELEDVAPHLVAIDLKNEFTHWLLENWRNNYGVLLQCPEPFRAVRRHLRRLHVVKDEAGRQYRFRYYDPRVLRAFLPVCTFEEVQEFCGPIVAWYAPAADGRRAQSFVVQTGRVASREIPPGRR